jgi:hypothetical protein
MRTLEIGRKMASALTAAAALTAMAGGAAASDRSAFEAKISKYAVGAYQSIKGVCVCQDGGTNHYRTGYLVRGNLQDGNGVEITASCSIPKFDGIDGELQTAVPCLTFEVLGR